MECNSFHNLFDNSECSSPSKRPLEETTWECRSAPKRQCSSLVSNSSSSDVFDVNDYFFSNTANNYSSSNSETGQSEQSSTSKTSREESLTQRRLRFLRTVQILKHSGLFEVTIRTAKLISKNQQLQKELQQLRTDSTMFLKDVLSNPENRNIVRILANSAQNISIPPVQRQANQQDTQGPNIQQVIMENHESLKHSSNNRYFSYQ